MSDTFLTYSGPLSSTAQARRSAMAWGLWLAALLGFTALTALLMIRGTPSFAVVGWVCFLVGIVAVLYEPRYGVYQLVGFGLAGDMLLTPWFPFVKNLSSAESLLYIGRATSFSPAEIFIGLTFISWLGRAAMQRKFKGFGGPLLWPALGFTFFVLFGLLYGITHHADRKIALWEVRFILCLPAMLFLTSNLIKTRQQLNTLIWVAMTALFFDACNGAWFVATILKYNLHSVESIAEHSFSIHLNTAFVLAASVWMFRGSRAKRVILPLMMPIMLFSYFANQRRASFITLALALALMAYVLYFVHRKVFWTIMPIAVVLGAVYLAAFWNSSGGIGMPARAIRSVIAPQQGGRDDSSNVYRVIENTNAKFTIKSRPLTGIGFGNKFFIVAKMPDISFFEWWEYITHNSIMWIWMQMGAGGFLAMLMLVGMSIVVGSRALWRMPGGDLSAITLTATLYIVMHFVYAYVDMSWEAQSMLYVGTMMGIVNCVERLADTPVPAPAKRWPWQPEPLPVPGLRPLHEGPYAAGKATPRRSRRDKRPASPAPAYADVLRPAAEPRR
ncbi:O-antigen ligase family protein [Kouleothrix sp.]|uniref:O-antigen ligase family protein n=1 Tax=Kouleothrix sp. TaxID=2779161 RepID=UPI0039199991